MERGGRQCVNEPETLTAQAIKASEVTHQHPEGIAGGMAVAHAAAIAAKARLTGAVQRPRTIVPFTLWFAAHHVDDNRKAITTCVQAGGDVDTTAAIVGKPPPESVAEREELPDWVRR